MDVAASNAACPSRSCSTPPNTPIPFHPVAAAARSQDGQPYPPPPGAEAFWPIQATVVAAIALQVGETKRLTAGPSWLVPALEGALLIGLLAGDAAPARARAQVRRRTAIGLTALVSAANIFSLVELTHLLLHHNVEQRTAADRLGRC